MKPKQKVHTLHHTPLFTPEVEAGMEKIDSLIGEWLDSQRSGDVIEARAWMNYQVLRLKKERLRKKNSRDQAKGLSQEIPQPEPEPIVETVPVVEAEVIEEVVPEPPPIRQRIHSKPVVLPPRQEGYRSRAMEFPWKRLPETQSE